MSTTLSKPMLRALRCIMDRAPHHHDDGWIYFGWGLLPTGTVEALRRRGVVETKHHTVTGCKYVKITDEGLRMIGLATTLRLQNGFLP